MTAFAERETLQAKIQAKRRQTADEDGFITVTRGARNGPAKQEAAQEQANKLKERQKGLDDFYRFQMRERRKAKAGELARRFEEDKEKVKRMREQRGKFKVGYGSLWSKTIIRLTPSARMIPMGQPYSHTTADFPVKSTDSQAAIWQLHMWVSKCIVRYGIVLCYLPSGLRLHLRDARNRVLDTGSFDPMNIVLIQFTATSTAKVPSGNCYWNALTPMGRLAVEKAKGTPFEPGRV